jgi:hypothetical protein
LLSWICGEAISTSSSELSSESPSLDSDAFAAFTGISSSLLPSSLSSLDEEEAFFAAITDVLEVFVTTFSSSEELSSSDESSDVATCLAAGFDDVTVFEVTAATFEGASSSELLSL